MDKKSILYFQDPEIDINSRSAICNASISIIDINFDKDNIINVSDITNPIAIIFEANKYSSIVDKIDIFEEEYPTLQQIVITPPTKNIVCEEKRKKHLTHISKNNPNLDEVVKIHIDTLVEEDTTNSESQCGSNMINIENFISDIQSTSLNSEDNIPNYRQNIKPYIQTLCKHSNIDDCIVTYNDIDCAETTRIIESTLSGIGDNVIKSTNKHHEDKEKIVEGSSENPQPLPYDEKTQLNIPYEYKTHKTFPIPVDDSEANLHLIYKTEQFNVLDQKTKLIVRMISHILSREIENTRSNKELMRNMEILQKFRYTISHDLMSPVSTAKGRMEIAQSKYDNKHIDIAYDAIKRVETMIKSTERLLSAGESINVDSRISMEKVCQDAWKIISVSQADLNVRDDFKLYADEPQLKTIMENIFKNSIEHGGRNVNIEVYKRTPIRTSTRDDPDESFSFVIEDDGDGIPDSIKDEIFERKKSTKNNKKVSGFGLSIVQSSVEAHGWNIDVAQSSTGAKFVISNVR